MATASTEAELRFKLMDNLSQYFAVQRWGIYLGDEQSGLISCDVRGVSDRFVERYQQIGKSVDPVLKYVQEYHAPAHEELVLPNQTWKQSELYQRCCIEYDHEHIMTGPIVGNGQLIGTIHFARIGHTPAFNTKDLSNLSAVCLHLSACLANLKSSDRFSQNSPQMLLTQREIQIAQLVARGLTNAEIGKELWISQNTVKQALKRMFRKLKVASRTEMVAQLRDLLI
ncbi:MAG: GAF domain-containing protein [Okeania sp. SIO2C9]|uniref:LuxR C-terminal-related transcriptional regulator n=1 Tax=Okeania sp. SIO2C9 TaxID=2607791 RepID=UPI0013C07FCF|nr:LuxR C-terminal-related transcriptional regulator [Okeania sp. SIO2C9]NEQ75835.1 GAF domain-containing protein [Okeania sp. SIO2C9]